MKILVKSFFFFLVSLSLLFFQCENLWSAESTVVKGVVQKSEEQSVWNLKMKELSQSLSNLLTHVTSDRLYSSTSNKKKIETELTKFSKLTHDLNQKSKTTFDKDPTLAFVSQLFMKKSNQALAALKGNQSDYARKLILSLPGYCITCHSRSGSGPQFTEIAIQPTVKNLSPLEKGEFYFASRQYDLALVEFRKMIEDKKIASSFNFEWDTSIYRALSISVRVKSDPTLTKDILQKIISTKNERTTIREDAKSWLKSAEEWSKETSKSNESDDELMTNAFKLMAKAKELQKFPMDRSADLIYLRASSYAHRVLKNSPHGKNAGDALLMLGISYEVLSPLKSEHLHDFYYESCIAEVPHSLTAELCYMRLEQSTMNGFTGSQGTNLPEDVKEKLNEFRNLSKKSDSKELPVQKMN